MNLNFKKKHCKTILTSVELEFLNTEDAPNADGEKAIHLDLPVRSDEGAVVDIEIQSGGITAARAACRVICVKAHRAFEFCQTPAKDTGQNRQSLHPNAPKLHFIEFGKLVSSRSTEDPIFKGRVDFMLPESVDDWERVAGKFAMFSELKKS